MRKRREEYAGSQLTKQRPFGAELLGHGGHGLCGMGLEHWFEVGSDLQNVTPLCAGQGCGVVVQPSPLPPPPPGAGMNVARSHLGAAMQSAPHWSALVTFAPWPMSCGEPGLRLDAVTDRAGGGGLRDGAGLLGG